MLWEPLGVEEPGPVGRCRPAGGAPAGRGGRAERRAGGGGRRVQAGRRGRRARRGRGEREAGVGKTTLIAEAARVAFDGGACVLFGHCEEDLARPVPVVRRGARPFRRRTPRDELVLTSAATEPSWPGWCRVWRVGCRGSAPSTATDADTGRYQLFAAVVELLVASCRVQQPVVLVLEDLQWADRASLQLLASRGRRRTGRCAARGRDVPRQRAVAVAPDGRARWPSCTGSGGVTRVELGGLDDAGVAAFIEAAAGQALDDGGDRFAAECTARPTATRSSSVRCCATSPRPARSTRTPTAAGSPSVPFDEMVLPPSVHAVIGGRVGRLGPEPNGCCRWPR